MKHHSISLIILLMTFFQSCSDSESVSLYFDENSTVISFGMTSLIEKLDQSGYVIEKIGSENQVDNEIMIIHPEADYNQNIQKEMYDHVDDVSHDGFKIIKQDRKIFILGGSERGCQYGIFEVVEQIKTDPDINHIMEKEIDPALSFRAIKFNLPWAPYRPGPATEIHEETCRDLKFWESFLDMMVENRFNALSLWSTHIFPFMIRSRSYPEATPFDDGELSEWRHFWKSLFKMAKDRGIETYLVNWNIVVSEAFANHYGATIHDDRSELVKKYTRESVTQLINEYEDLSGLGVTLADWMGNWGDDKMTPVEREKWIEDTFVEGIKKADRKVKFIHRAVLAGDPKEMRKVIDKADLPEKTIVEVKFNWSHGHSTPNLSITHANDEGTIMRDFWDPDPTNYFIAWMIRNEDFFVLRWGNPEFIRNHILTNNHSYVDGYFIGSEGYIPALDYSTIDLQSKSWDYAFQKQWLFYSLWGRLMYDPSENNKSLSRLFKIRYKEADADKLLQAYSIASEVPLKIASFYKGTWDFTLYSEGFLAPWPYGYDDGNSPFISIEELINHETLDQDYLSVSNYCNMIIDKNDIDPGKTTPLELADYISNNCIAGIELINELRVVNNDPTLGSELDDLETWCNLGFYFADKIRAGVSVSFYLLSGGEAYKKSAIDYLEKCVNHWDQIVLLTKDRYKPMPYVSMGHHESRWPEFKTFHWENFLSDVKEDVEYVKNLE